MLLKNRNTALIARVKRLERFARIEQWLHDHLGSFFQVLCGVAVLR